VPSAPTLRRAGEPDVEAIAGIHVRSWQWAYRGLIPDAGLDSLTVAERLPGWRSALGPGTVHRVWLAEQDGRGVGFAAWGPVRDADLDPATAELYAIYLDPAAAGTGVATALMAAAAGEMRQQGRARAVLWVLAANPRARRFYERGGWVVDGSRKTVTLRGASLEAVRYALAL
jgi:GNAT superfamily N-acetyltransferase